MLHISFYIKVEIHRNRCFQCWVLVCCNPGYLVSSSVMARTPM
jgi:hypothetical protein